MPRDYQPLSLLVVCYSSGHYPPSQEAHSLGPCPGLFQLVRPLGRWRLQHRLEWGGGLLTHILPSVAGARPSRHLCQRPAFTPPQQSPRLVGWMSLRQPGSEMPYPTVFPDIISYMLFLILNISIFIFLQLLLLLL